MEEFIVALINGPTPVFVENYSLPDYSTDYTSDPLQARTFRGGNWAEAWSSDGFVLLPVPDLADPQATLEAAVDAGIEYQMVNRIVAANKEVEIMEVIPMEAWRKTWRDGVEPLLTLPQLEALRDGIVNDDEHLIQGATTMPPPLQVVQDWDCEGACLLGYAAWKGDGLQTVGEVEQAFAEFCFRADQRLGEPAGIRWLLNEYDTWPREEMIRNLLPEIESAIARRQGLEVPA